MKKRTTRALALAALLAALCPLFAFGASDFTAASEMVQSEDERGKAWAEYIAKSAGATTDTEKIRAIYAWYTNGMDYDKGAVAAVRDLPASEHALHIPRHDYLSVLASAAAYARGESKSKPQSLCGGYAHGIAGSLRALGIPVKIEIGKLTRMTKKGEAYFDENGVRRVSAGKGETPHRYYDGRWVKITDAHARLSIWAESYGRWISADPTFDSIAGGEAYFDMSAAKYGERWSFLYISSEKTPRAWKENPLPAPVIPAPLGSSAP
jgi:transglutaminase-like putative cysteine protease